MDPLTGIFTASPKHLGFRLYINMSYAALTATPGAKVIMGLRFAVGLVHTRPVHKLSRYAALTATPGAL